MAVESTPSRGAAIFRLRPDGQRATGRVRLTPFGPAAREPSEPEAAPQLQVRLAVYSASHLPAVYDLFAEDPGDLLAEACDRALTLARQQHSPVPSAAVVAVIENLIHARFHMATVSLGADGSVTVSDQGPGIEDKTRALLPGFTTATPDLRRYIRGVGSGLPVAQQLMQEIRGELRIEDNLAGGTVVTLAPPSGALSAPGGSPVLRPAPMPQTRPLTPRQQRLVLLLADAGEMGPSAVSQHLGVSLTTAFRELVALEGYGLVAARASGKRALTARGIEMAERIAGEEMGGSPRP